MEKKPTSQTLKSLVSVVIPTLSRKSLKEAISSCGDLPVITERDTHRTGAGPTRNRGVQRVKTEWVAFLDDDDKLNPNFQEAFQEALEEDPHLIIFKMKYPDGRILPRVPLVEWFNVGISIAVKTSLAKKYPFVKGSNEFRQNEDFQFIKRIQDEGYKIHFSPRITYLVKPDKESQANAKINHRD